jgi:hypothetical protein
MRKSVLLVLFFLTTTSLIAQEHVPGILLVRLENGMEIEDIISEIEPKPISYKQLRTSFKPNAVEKQKLYTLKFNDDEDIESLANRVGEINGVKWAEPNYVCKQKKRSKPVFKSQGILINSGILKTIETELAYIRYIPVQEEILVAVIDDGIDYNHTSLKDVVYNNLSEIPDNGIDDDSNGLVDDYMGYDFGGYYDGGGDNDPAPKTDSSTLSHGTMIAGIIGAKPNYKNNHVGVNPNCKILNIKKEADDEHQTSYDIAAAIRYAVDMGAKVINMSFSAVNTGEHISEALSYASSEGVILLTSAGNDGIELYTEVMPAGYSGTITIGSHNNSGVSISSFSNYGPLVSFASYGESIYSTNKDSSYYYDTGTSFSCPIVAGIVSRILGNDPTMKSADVFEKLIVYSQKLDDEGEKIKYGKILSEDLAKSYVDISKKIYNLVFDNNSVQAEIVLIKKDGLLLNKVLEYIFFKDKRYSIHKDIL